MQGQKQTAYESLVEGYKRFKKLHFENKELYSELVEFGQQPKVLMVACCDSRVDPAIVTQCKPGELFVVRNVANLVPPFLADPRHHGTSAALEFGIVGLNVSDVIIFGHSHCGGIRALITTQESETNFIGSWMNIAQQAKQQVLSQYATSSIDEQAHHCEKASLLVSLENLMTFPWIKKRVAEKTLSVHAWYFNLINGDIEAYDDIKKQFISVTGPV